MPRIQYFTDESITIEPVTDAQWAEFDRAIRSDADPRESKRPVEDDEWCDEDDYEGDDE